MFADVGIKQFIPGVDIFVVVGSDERDDILAELFWFFGIDVGAVKHCFQQHANSLLLLNPFSIFDLRDSGFERKQQMLQGRASVVAGVGWQDIMPRKRILYNALYRI